MANTILQLEDWVLGSESSETVIIGYSAENSVDQLIIECDAILDGFTYFLDYMDSRGNRDELLLTVDGTNLSLTLTDGILGTLGFRMIQVVAQNTNGAVRKSNMFKVFVRDSVNSIDAFPQDAPTSLSELVQYAIDAATDSATSATQSANSATQSANSATQSANSADASAQSASEASTVAQSVATTVATNVVTQAIEELMAQGEDGQILTADGNGGYEWVSTSVYKLYPGGIMR